MTRQTHTVAIPFEQQYPDVLAVCCSDGRYIEAVGAFLGAQGVARHDLIALPGGPAQLCPKTASPYQQRVTTEAFDFLVESHQTRRVILIAHEHCGYYLKRLGKSEEARQIEDLRRVQARILSRHARIDVSLFFAKPQPGVGCTLEEL